MQREKVFHVTVLSFFLISSFLIFSPVSSASNSVINQTVNPYAHVGRAFGIVSYGLYNNSGTISSYSVETIGLAGIASIESISAQSIVSNQLNGMLVVVNNDGTRNVYWVDEALALDTQTQKASLWDDILNVSSNQAALSSSSISSSEGDAFNGSSFGIQFNPQYLANNWQSYSVPLKYTLFTDASILSGTGVIINASYYFNSGYLSPGLGTFDQITIHDPTANSAYFLVSGSEYSPTGMYYDSEFIFGGQNTTLNVFNADLRIAYYNSQSQNVTYFPSAYSFADDTNASVSNLHAVYDGSAVVHLQAGTPNFVYIYPGHIGEGFIITTPLQIGAGGSVLALALIGCAVMARHKPRSELVQKPLTPSEIPPEPDQSIFSLSTGRGALIFGFLGATMLFAGGTLHALVHENLGHGVFALLLGEQFTSVFISPFGLSYTLVTPSTNLVTDAIVAAAGCLVSVIAGLLIFLLYKRMKNQSLELRILVLFTALMFETDTLYWFISPLVSFGDFYNVAYALSLNPYLVSMVGLLAALIVFYPLMTEFLRALAPLGRRYVLSTTSERFKFLLKVALVPISIYIISSAAIVELFAGSQSGIFIALATALAALPIIPVSYLVSYKIKTDSSDLERRVNGWEAREVLQGMIKISFILILFILAIVVIFGPVANPGTLVPP